MPEFRFEPADRIVPALLHQTFQAAFSDYLIGAFDLPLAQWPHFLARQGIDLSLSRVALGEAGPLAFAFVAPRPELGHWRLATMGAPPAARGSGAAAALLDDFVARAGAAGQRGVELECFALNERALRLYQGRGFMPIHPLHGYVRPAAPPPGGRPDAGAGVPIPVEEAFEWLADVNLQRGDLPLQVTPVALRALPVALQAWRFGGAQLVFAAAGEEALTIHSLVDIHPSQGDAQVLAQQLVARHPRHRIAVPQLQRPDLGGDALERTGFQRLPLHQWLMRRAL
jgi:ribosomal protein S18 acetylase RimI-like enzyme